MACADAGLSRLRLCDLRHMMASRVIVAVENLSLVGKLLGHRRHRTTAGYAHLDDAHLVDAEKVGAIIARRMLDLAPDTPTGPTPAGQTLQQKYPPSLQSNQLWDMGRANSVLSRPIEFLVQDALDFFCINVI